MIIMTAMVSLFDGCRWIDGWLGSTAAVPGGRYSFEFYKLNLSYKLYSYYNHSGQLNKSPLAIRGTADVHGSFGEELQIQMHNSK